MTLIQAIWILNNLYKTPPNGVMPEKWYQNRKEVVVELQKIIDETEGNLNNLPKPPVQTDLPKKEEPEPQKPSDPSTVQYFAHLQ